MVQTRSSHPSLEFPSGVIGSPAASNNQDMANFMRRMTKSIEALRKQNEDL